MQQTYRSFPPPGLALLILLASACGDSGGGSGGDIDAGPDQEDIDAGGDGDECGLVSCESAGATCGPVGDGCGGTIDSCGECDAPETCGGGGSASACGGNLGCVPGTCDTAGANCGPIGDGCGGSIDSCGDCEDDEACGAGGPSVCGTLPCVGLCEDQVDCDPGVTTSVSGTVFTPAGDLPLYNVTVYVPNGPLETIPTGNDSCLSCDAPLSGDPLVWTTTNSDGDFVLEDVPVGTDIPLVIQTGKWRRVITIPTVSACVDTPLAAGDTRFPRTQGEFGVALNNIPKIALTTGGADALECLLRKIGIADSEFTNPAGTGRVNLYAGNGGTDRYKGTLNSGASFPEARDLWNDVDDLDEYDMVVLSCQGGSDDPADSDDPGFRDATAYQDMKDYLYLHGGRVFGSHWHHAWAELGPSPMPDVATFNHRGDLPADHTVFVNTDPSFAKGLAFADWLVSVGASTTYGELVLIDGQHTVESVDPTYSTTWISGTNPDAMDAPGVQYFHFNTPIETPIADQCGRMVVTDIHVAAGDDSDTSYRFPDADDDGGAPAGCTSTGLLPEEKALIFLLFDLASCITTDDPGCDARTCDDVGANCGPLADGCGELLDCGTCEPPDTCGGGGTPNVCGNDGCVAIECADVGADCGPIADGCGDTVDCGDCEPPETCGGGGTPNVCGQNQVD